MITTRAQVLKPLLESQNGIHLTAYVTQDSSFAERKRQIQDIIDIAFEHLAPVLKPDEMARFLDPIQKLREDSRLLRNIRGNLGLFRTPHFFRILNIPSPVEPLCVVASSFHVKPLLKWLQMDREFLLLGINNEGVRLYQGNLHSINHIDSAILPRRILSGGRLKDDREPYLWISNWLMGLVRDSGPKLFVAGPTALAEAFLKKSKYKNRHHRPIWNSFDEDQVFSMCMEIRSRLRVEARSAIETALQEFRFAEDFNLAQKNIFEISKMAIRGQVKKLIVADGINIFGKLDRNSGQIRIHPAHLDHEDDDLLDDLAQEVLRRGGEVIVSEASAIPKGRPILAILDDEPDSPELQMAPPQKQPNRLVGGWQ